MTAIADAPIDSKTLARRLANSSGGKSVRKGGKPTWAWMQVGASSTNNASDSQVDRRRKTDVFLSDLVSVDAVRHILLLSFIQSSSVQVIPNPTHKMNRIHSLPCSRRTKSLN